MADRAIPRTSRRVKIPTMRLPPLRTSVPSLISTVFVLCVMLAFVAELRERAERARRKAALPAVWAAYRKAMIAREFAESTAASFGSKWVDDAMVQEIQSQVEHARADERAKKAEYDRLRDVRPGRFW